MATYTRPDKFIPVNISSDPSAYLGYVQKRLDLSATGEAAVKSQYKQMLDLDLTHDANKEKLNSFLVNAANQINKTTNKDLSDLNNVKKALSVFDPLSKDPQYQSILYDNKYTKHYQQQFEIAEQFKNKIDKKGNVGGGFSQDNFAELQQKYQGFKNANGTNKDTYGDLYSYNPYYDYKEEIANNVKEFIKLPDDYELEEVDPNTGVTKKTKIKGKGAQEIQAYLNNTLSNKAKDQILLEGRVRGRSIDDNEFLTGLRQSTVKNLEQLKANIHDLEVFKIDPSNPNITKEQIDQKIRDNKANIEELNSQLSKLNDEKETVKLINSKADIYANTYLNEKIASLASATDNKRYDQTFGSNSAIVSLLNRNQGFLELQMKLQLQRQMHNDNIKLKYDTILAKEFGINPLTGKSATAPNGDAVITNDPETKYDDVVKGVNDYEKELNSSINSALKDVAQDAYKALGLTEYSFDNDKKALAYVFSIVNDYNGGKLNMSSILKKADGDLTPEERVKKSIVQKLEQQDGMVSEANAYNIKKTKLISDSKKQIIKDLNAKGITLEDINNNLNNHINAPKDAYDMSFLVSGALGLQNKYNNTGYGKINSLDEFADRVISDPEFAKNISNNFKESLNNPTGIGAINHMLNLRKSWNNTDVNFAWNDQLKGMQIKFKEDKVANLNLDAYGTKINQDLSQNYALTSMKEVISRPPALNTTSEKVANERFNQRVTAIIAEHKDAFPELTDIDPNAITRINRKNGKIVLEGFNTELDEKTGKFIRKDKIEPIEIDAPNLKITSDVDKSYMRALALDDNGVIKKQLQTEYGVKNYKIKTASGNPYSASGVTQQGLIATIEIDGRDIPLPQEFETPTAAIQAVQKFFSSLNTKMTQLAIQEELVKHKDLPVDEAKKIVFQKLMNKEIQKITEDNINNLYKSGDIYRAFNQQNPNLTPSQQAGIDFLENYGR